MYGCRSACLPARVSTKPLVNRIKQDGENRNEEDDLDGWEELKQGKMGGTCPAAVGSN